MAQGDRHALLDEERARAVQPQPPDDLHEVAHGDRRQAERRLVDEEEARTGHEPFGRVGKRFEEAAFARVLTAVEKATGRHFSDEERRRIAHGADEIDLVNSGLEETMIGAYHQIRELQKRDRRVSDLRTAAFLNALNKIATSYLELGIFP